MYDDLVLDIRGGYHTCKVYKFESEEAYKVVIDGSQITYFVDKNDVLLYVKTKFYFTQIKVDKIGFLQYVVEKGGEGRDDWE